MARIRTIKPEFFTSEDIVSLTPLARLFYVSLWCEADRGGRFSWKPRTLKMRYFPVEDCDIEELAAELVDAGLVVLYEVDGLQYAHIPSFERHQSINNRESASVIPAPPSKKGQVPQKQQECTSKTGNDPSSMEVHDACLTRQDASQGKEGKEGKERKGTRVTAGFDEFWSAYPRKVSKGDAEKAFAKLNPDEHLLGTILAAVQRAKTREQWQKDGGKFIPHASTWLNGRRWEDDDIAEPSASTHRRNPIFEGCL